MASWLLGFSGFAGYDPNLLLELLALKYGLLIAWNQGYKHILCNSDSIKKFRLIKIMTLIFIIMDICSLLSREWEVQLSYTL